MQNLGLLVPILAILLGPLMYWMHIKEKKISITSDLAAQKAAQDAARMTALEERLKVVEQIVTDGGYETAAQIEALRKPSLTQGSKLNA
ncbi:hypothetical protein M8312_02225 [Sphingomonas sp. KRR8]|uniref:hypothetical protein n=1 Tax=Sphingomonas sp. KRR8 TaxID=2942996 RepID=UPI0020223160|nr:hypothetical protein [Sphingomonas sp. KRR8]URD61352.1 hypothetical protein M8312_02225 [Sphingomonas sp. KRR8]